MQFIDLQAQYQPLKKRIDQRIQTVLDHGKYIMGPEVQELEQRLAEYVGVKHVITCANGTDALSLCLMGLDIGENDAVFCPTFTFFSTAEVVSLAKATPIFVDSDKKTFNICPEDLEDKIIKTLGEGRLKPKVIIAVDLFGLPANYPEIEKIAKKYGLKIIEDAAQGFGGSIGNKKAGSFGFCATTSFFPAKPLGCYGDGGAVFTNCNDFAEIVRSLGVHGKGKNKYDNVRIGLNSRLDTVQAAVLLEKLSVFPKELIARNKLAKKYTDLFRDQFVVPTIPEDYCSSWAQYTLLDENRSKWMEKLKEKGVPTAIYYSACLHQQKAFSYLTSDHFCPNAELLARKVFSLPMHGYMKDSDLNIIFSCMS